MIRFAALGLLVALAAACSGPAPSALAPTVPVAPTPARSAPASTASVGPTDVPRAPFELWVDDRSSWGTLQVVIGTAVVGHVGCDVSLKVAPGDPGVPPLPWSVRLVTASGQTIDQRMEDGAGGSRWLLVWDAEVDEGDTPALGPMPECAMPSPSIAPLPTAGLTITAAIDTGERLLADRTVGAVAVRTATIGRLARYTTRAGVDPDTFVWALTYTGAFSDPSTCRPSPVATPCPGMATALVVLDFPTGADLFVAIPAPR